MDKHILPILLAGLLCFSMFPAVAQTERYQPVDKTSLEGSRYEIVIPTRDERPSLFKQLIAVSSSEIYLVNLNTGILWEYTNE